MTNVNNNIYTALLEVYQKVGYVQKKGKNTGQGYSYAGEKDFIEALRPAMIEAQIIVYPSGVKDKSMLEIRKGDKGDKIALNLTATYLFTYVHVPSGTSILTEVSGEGSDPLDKGSYKAMTGAYKYALRQTFMIETGNDPERHDEPVEPVKAAPVPSKFQSAASKKQYIADYFAELERCKDIDDLNAVIVSHAEDLNVLLATYTQIVGKQTREEITKREGVAKQRLELNDDINRVMPA